MRADLHVTPEIGRVLGPSGKITMDGRMDTKDEGEFWAEVSGRLLHPVQLQIIEAMRRIELPLSASDVTRILDGRMELSTVAYHFRRLAKLGVIKPNKTEQIRGALRRPHHLAGPGG